MRGHLLFGGGIILELTRYATVHDDKSGLVRSCHARYMSHVDVLIILDTALPVHGRIYRIKGPYPAAVQPEQVHPAISGHQFLDLFVSIVLKSLPAVRMLGR